MSAELEAEPTFFDKFPEEAKVVRAAFLGSFFALGLGAVFGIIRRSTGQTSFADSSNRPTTTPC
jgi:hypothetical protein